MAKKKASAGGHTAARRTVADEAALEKRHLRTLIHAKRDIARLANELQRATRRADQALISLADEIALDFGKHLVPVDENPAPAPPANVSAGV